MLADLPTDPLTMAVYIAVMGLMIAAANALQTWFQLWRARLLAEKQRRTVLAAKRAARKSLSVNIGNSEKLDGVYEALNGNGITGELRKINQWQVDHETADSRRHQEITEKVDANTDALKSAMENPVAPK